MEKAKEYGIRIAFENTEGEEFLFALMEYFKDDAAVGFCWDSGHEMCYSYGKDLLSRCKGGIESIKRFASEEASVDKTYLK